MEKLRVAVVGAGILGSRHARVFHEMNDTELVAVADHTLERAQQAAAPAGAAAFTDLDELLSAVPCDAVAVATPDHQHRQPVLHALEAGKHVLVEKPLATTMDDAEAMIAQAAQAGRVLQVNYSQRYVPEYAFMKQQIAAGVLGEPAFAISSKQDRIYVPTRMISWAAQTSPIFFMSSHDIDLVSWFVGRNATRVTAMERRGALSGLGIDTHDSVDALVDFEGGFTANFHSSWVLPDTYPTMTVDRLTVVGAHGLVHFESRDRSVEYYALAGGQRVVFTGPQTATEVDGRITGAFRTSLEQFVSAIRSGAEPRTSARLTLHVTAIQTAILASIRTRATTPVG